MGTKVFKSRWQNNALGELIVYDLDRQYPLIAAVLKTKGHQVFTQLPVSEAAKALPELPYLLAYAWYTFLPASMQGADNDTLVLLAAAG